MSLVHSASVPHYLSSQTVGWKSLIISHIKTNRVAGTISEHGRNGQALNLTHDRGVSYIHSGRSTLF